MVLSTNSLIDPRGCQTTCTPFFHTAVRTVLLRRGQESSTYECVSFVLGLAVAPICMLAGHPTVGMGAIYPRSISCEARRLTIVGSLPACVFISDAWYEQKD